MVIRRTAKCGLAMLAAAVVAGTGCNRQDADGLARIGHLLMQRAKSFQAKSSPNNKLTKSLPGLTIPDDGGEVEQKAEEQTRSEPASRRPSDK